MSGEWEAYFIGWGFPAAASGLTSYACASYSIDFEITELARIEPCPENWWELVPEQVELVRAILAHHLGRDPDDSTVMRAAIAMGDGELAKQRLPRSELANWLAAGVQEVLL